MSGWKWARFAFRVGSLLGLPVSGSIWGHLAAEDARPRGLTGCGPEVVDPYARAIGWAGTAAIR